MSAVMRGGSLPATLSSEGLNTAEQRALLVHSARIDTAQIPAPGILGYHDDSFSEEDVTWHRFELNPQAARFIHLIPEGDGPVRVTMGWEDESSELDMRLTSPSFFGRPLTVNEKGLVTRGDNSSLMAERVDIPSGAVDEEFTVQITGRDGELFEKNNTDAGPRKAFLLISGARLSNQMKQQQAFTAQMKEQYAQDRLEVDAYVEKHNIPVREELDNGRVREIVRIEDGKPVYYYTMNLGAAQTSHADKVWPGGGMDISVTGSNLPPLGIWDEGPVRASHQEFDGRVTVVDQGSNSAHGTHVGGTMIASGVNGSAKGMSHEASLRSYNWNNAVEQMANEASSNGMLVSQHSYGVPEDYTYGRSAEDWDNMHLNYPYKLGSKSAANEGGDWTVTDAGNAKNNITIGAIDEISGGWERPGQASIAGFSSRGPVRNSNNRIKPDVVAKGVNVYSTGHNSDDGYTGMSGTSMAGPAAAGMLGLMQDYYYQTHDKSFMRSTTLKALAIHTAGEAGTEGPNSTYGWGVVHVQRAARLIGKNGGGEAGFIQELTLNNDETLEFEYSGSGEEEIAATIVWMDEAQVTLVDDIDLRVAVDGETYEPWYISGTGAASKGDNTADNVERVNTGVTQEGASVTIDISHKGSLTGNSRKLSLIVSGVSGDEPEYITILSPSENEELMAESEHTIRWESEGDIENVHIEWGHAEGEWSTVESSASNSGTYTWNVPDTSHDQCALRISEVDGDVSDQVEYFSISQKPSISVPELVIDTSLRNNEEAFFDLDIENVGRGVLNADLSQTSSPSDLIEAAGWSADADDFGSEIDTAGGIVQNGTASMGYSIVEQPDDDSWPWAIMTASLDQDFTGLEHIEISYTSDHEVSLLLDQTGLSESGTSHRAVLPPSGSVKDTVLSVAGDFSQPDWVDETTPLDLSEVESASFSISPEYTSETVGDIVVSSLSFDGMDLPDTESPVSLDKTELEIAGESSETVRIFLSSGDYDIGEYSDTVVITHNDPDTDAIRIPVRLDIIENRNPEFDNIQTEYDLDPGDDFELEVSASDPDDDAVTLSTEELPDWLSADDSESGVLRITGSTDDSHAEMNYSFQVAASDDFDPVGQAELGITIKVGTDIVEIDTVSGSQRGIFPAQNPGRLSAESFDFTVMTGKPATVRIVIYDNLGNILDEQEKSGSTATGHVLSWDMRNLSGQKVGAGSYLIAAEITYENGMGTTLRQMVGLKK
ncbi:MAG: S8 family serine peptidase [Fibrobacterota bacterium]